MKAIAFMAGLWSVSSAYGAAYAVESCVLRMFTILMTNALGAKQGEN